MSIIGSSSTSSAQYIDIENDLVGGERRGNIKMQAITHLLTFYILTLSIGEIVLSYLISNSTNAAADAGKDCSFFITANIWFMVQGILSITYVLFAYVIYYYRYKTDILQKISYKINTHENYDLVKILYYGFCFLYQFFIVVWIIFGTIVLLMECSFTDNTVLNNAGISVLFLEYVTLISFMKMILSIRLIE